MSTAGFIAVGLLPTAFLLGLWLGRRRTAQLATEVAVLNERLKAGAEIERERQETVEHAMQGLKVAFNDLAGRNLRESSEHFLRLARASLGEQQQAAAGMLKEREVAVEALVRPIATALEKTEGTLRELETARSRESGSLRQHLHDMRELHLTLQRETRSLANALRRPQVRGRWGELTLRRLVELAGMSEHCDFDEQVHVNTESGALRPDMVVHMSDGRDLVVDVKTPLDAYLTAMEAQSEEERAQALRRHAQHVADRVGQLSSKAYWSQFPSAPQFVVLFIPGDQFLAAALDEKPDLLEKAMESGVILATPTNFIAVLKSIAYGWRQVQLTEHAEQIRRLAEDLYQRLAVFRTHMAKLGGELEASVRAFNSAVGSLERNVLPGARKFTELGLRSDRSIEVLETIETTPRGVELPRADADTPPAGDTR
ncbi:MAG: DNA recombination protein RmuC [Steroidobacteraceae bacterium]